MDEHKTRVLIVEDHTQTQEVLNIYLDILGFEFEIVGNGLEALAALPRFNPDVILLDLRMPVMDGWEFMRAYPGPVPIVVLSAYTDVEELPREPFAIMFKPSDMREVAVMLRQAARSGRGL